MQQKTYRAPMAQKYFHTLIGVFLLVAISIVFLKKVQKIGSGPSVVVLLIILVVFVPILLALVHKYPNLKTDEKYLYVQYFLGYKSVPWNDVVAVKKPIQGEVEKVTALEVRNLPFPFRIIGLIYNELSTSPVVLLSSSMDNLDELLDEIKAKGTL